MFSNVLDEKRYIQEVADASTGKHYNVHVTFCVPKISPLAGMLVFAGYMTNADPHCEVLVGFIKKAYFDDEFETMDELLADLEKRIQDALPAGFKRFEAILASGLQGNEYMP